MARIDAFLKLGTQQGCSDVHLAVGVPPMLRMHGDLLPIKFRDLRLSELEGYITEILTRSQNEHFNTGRDLDFSYVSADGGRSPCQRACVTSNFSTQAVDPERLRS